jgi:DNA ligase-1
MPPIQVRYDQGIHLPELDLWLDPPRGKERAFISHAHSDHFARHKWTVCSEITAALIENRYGKRRVGTTSALPLRETLVTEGHSLVLLPAGHIFGSAMLHVTRLCDGATLLYTGDFKLRDSLTTEAAELRKADSLILETTFGLPQYRFPPRADVLNDMRRFVEEALADGSVPVLLGYSLGKAQELIAMLAEFGHPIMVHVTIAKFTELFRDHGMALPEHKVLNIADVIGHIVIAPPNAVRSLSEVTKCRTAMATGWALMKGAKYRFRVDEIFPISDHADHPELHQCVTETGAKHIYTVHGYTTEFARELRLLGHEAWSLIKEEQRELFLNDTPVLRERRSP